MLNHLSKILGARLISVTELSEGTGISRNTITGLYYRRTKTIKLETLTKICDYLQIPLSELIEYEPKKEGD